MPETWPPPLANRKTRRNCEHRTKGGFCILCGVQIVAPAEPAAVPGGESNGLTYVVCDRLLDAETNEHCEFDGRVEVDARGYWQCPGCGARRYGTGAGGES